MLKCFHVYTPVFLSSGVKRIICFLVCVILINCATLGSVFANIEYVYTEPKPVSETLTEYASWFYNFHLRTDEMEVAGKRGGMGGQRIYCFDVSPFDENNLVFGADTTAIYYSFDGGKSWKVSCDEGINAASCYDIAFDPYNEGVVWAVLNVGYGNYDYNMTNPESCGIYKSLNNGKSWEQVYEGVSENRGIVPEIIDFDSDGNVYVYLLEGVLKSSDSGTTWENIGSACVEGAGVYNTSLSVTDDGSVIITANNIDGINVSFDGGESWISKNPYTADSVYVHDVEIDPDDKTHWYSTTGGDFAGHIFETKDSGTTWTDLGLVYRYHYAQDNVYGTIKFGAKNSYGIRRMFICGHTASRVARYSDDGGVSWEEIDFTVNDEFAGGAYFSSPFAVSKNDNNKIYFAAESHINMSYDNGDTWTCNMSGFSGYVARQFRFDEEGYLYVPMHDFAYYKSNEIFKKEKGEYPNITAYTNKVTRWNGSQTCGDIDIDPNDSKHILASIGKYGDMIVEESFDGGESWIQHTDTSNVSEIDLVKFHSDNENIIYTSYFISYDGGESWVSKDGICVKDVYSENNDIIVGTKASSKTNTRIFCLSKDKGENWTEIEIKGAGTSDVKFDVLNPNVVWAAGGNGSVTRVDFEKEMYTVFGTKNGLGTNRLYRIAQNPNNPNHLLTCGTPYKAYQADGLYETYDGGNTWHIVPGIPGTRSLYSVAFNPNEDTALIGSYMGTFIYDYKEFLKYKSNNDNYLRNIKIYGDNSQANSELACGAVYAGVKQNTVQGELIKGSYDANKIYKWSEISAISIGTVYNDDGSFLRDVRSIFSLDLNGIDDTYIKSIKFNFSTSYFSDGAVLKINRYVGNAWDKDEITHYNLIDSQTNILNKYCEKTVNKKNSTLVDGTVREFSVDVTDLFDRVTKKLDIICSATKESNIMPVYHDGGFVKMNAATSTFLPYFTVEYLVPYPTVYPPCEANEFYNAFAYAPDNCDSLCMILAFYNNEGNLLNVSFKQCNLNKFGKAHLLTDLSYEASGAAEKKLFVFEDIESIIPVYKTKMFSN